jgi:DNA-binding CsgD family transcriptional regulator
MAKPIALLEREDELATIERVIGSAVSGEGGLLMIEGEAGVGKTALLNAAGRLGEERKVQVLRARGGEYERDFPYGVVRQLFEPLFNIPERRGELLVGNGAAAAPVFEPATAPNEGADPFTVQLGLQQVVLTLAESTPLLMLVDDAQWADLASLRALAYVGRRLGGQQAVLALSVRKGEPGEHESLLDELRREPGALTIVPSPLSTAAVGELVAAEGGRAPGVGFAAACRDATAGNPFLLVELLRALDLGQVDGISEDAEGLAELAAAGASRAILSRLARLGEPVVAAARAVAVLEPNSEAGRIAALSGLSLDPVADACEHLVVAGLLSDTQPVGFVHPLVRAAVLSEMPEPRRAADHARAARLLSDDGAAPDAVAAHLLLAEPGGAEWVVAALRFAAAEALGRGAPAAAVSYLRRALHEPPPKPDRLATSRELGVALLRADEPEGIEVLRAVRAAESDPVVRAELATELSISLSIRRPGGEGVAMIEESLREIPDHRSGLGLFLRGFQLDQLLSGMERIPDVLDLEPEGWPDGATGEGRFFLRQLAFLYAVGFGEMENVMELVERHSADLALYASDVRAGRPAHYVLAAMTLADRGDLTAKHFETALEVSRERGTVAGMAAVHGMRAWCLCGDGDLREARLEVDTALRLIEPTGLRTQLVNWLSGGLRILVAQGEPAAAEELQERVWGGREPGPGLPGASLLTGRGELRLARGLYAEARHDFLAAGERVSWLPYANPEVIGWRTGLALAEDALGNEGEARRLAAEAVRLAREAGGQRGIGLTLRVLGTVTKEEEGIELLREAADVLSGTRARFQHAIALAELGAALRRANRRRDARKPLREGLDLAHRCGAAALEERARTELQATGARPRKAILTGVESLTPSELRVARMAADGMTNREIAQDLYVTAKTVETHLRHVYRKLDGARRTDLAEILDVA